MEKIKRLLPFLLAAAVVVALCAGMVYRYQNTWTNEDFIRFHVVANSDSEEDQELKLKVRDQIIGRATEILEASSDRNDAARRLD